MKFDIVPLDPILFVRKKALLTLLGLDPVRNDCSITHFLGVRSNIGHRHTNVLLTSFSSNYIC